MPASLEIRNRIRLAVAAYAYEFHDDPYMSDAEFDKLALEVKPELSTGRDEEDAFFRDEFDPHSGFWVRKHPNISGLDRIYRSYYRDAPRYEEIQEIESLI